MAREPSSSSRLAMCSGDGPIFTSADDAGGVSRAALGVFDDDREISHRTASHVGSFGCKRLQLHAVNRRRLARHAVVVHGVHAVGGQVHLVNGRAVLFNHCSTAIPAEVRSSASWRSSAATLTNSRSHEGRILMIQSQLLSRSKHAWFDHQHGTHQPQEQNGNYQPNVCSIAGSVGVEHSILALHPTQLAEMPTHGFSCSVVGETR